MTLEQGERSRDHRCFKILKKFYTFKKIQHKKKQLEEAYGVMEPNMVDMKIIRDLYANDISFNVLGNPQEALNGYKPPSSQKARIVLLDIWNTQMWSRVFLDHN